MEKSVTNDEIKDAFAGNSLPLYPVMIKYKSRPPLIDNEYHDTGEIL